jgi:hypothetical protein
MTEPFLGQIRMVPYATMPRQTFNVNIHSHIEPVAAYRLEQWNGTEWVLVWDYQP